MSSYFVIISSYFFTAEDYIPADDNCPWCPRFDSQLFTYSKPVDSEIEVFLISLSAFHRVFDRSANLLTCTCRGTTHV